MNGCSLIVKKGDPFKNGRVRCSIGTIGCMGRKVRMSGREEKRGGVSETDYQDYLVLREKLISFTASRSQ